MSCSFDRIFTEKIHLKNNIKNVRLGVKTCNSFRPFLRIFQWDYYLLVCALCRTKLSVVSSPKEGRLTKPWWVIITHSICQTPDITIRGHPEDTDHSTNIHFSFILPYFFHPLQATFVENAKFSLCGNFRVFVAADSDKTINIIYFASVCLTLCL